MLRELDKEVNWMGIDRIVGGYWCTSECYAKGSYSSNGQIFRSKAYPEGITAHPLDEQGKEHRINLLCSEDDFTSLLAIHRASRRESMLQSIEVLIEKLEELKDNK